jgi:SAM-dependent methyltransferase
VIAEGTPPERFALEHAHYAEDLPFWRGLARDRGGPVLDLGAAVGRVTVPLARDGHEVWALDGSPGMLQQLGLRLQSEPAEVVARVRCVVADLRDFALGRTFPLAIMPMNTLQALLTRTDQLACLRRIRTHLDADGEFVFDVAVPDLDAIEGQLGAVAPGAFWRDGESGATLAHSARFDSVDRRTGTVGFTAQIDEIGPDGVVTTHLRPHTVHLFPPSEMWELIVDAGMAVHAVHGDFAGGALEPGADRQIIRCGVARE